MHRLVSTSWRFRSALVARSYGSGRVLYGRDSVRRNTCQCTHRSFVGSLVGWFVGLFVGLFVRSFVRWTRFASTFTYAGPSRLDTYAPLHCTHTGGHRVRVHTHHHRVLYNAAIDSRPLFHARDLLQSLQPVSGDSVQCPVSLPVSVHKIYFPMRYTGWHRENWTRSLDTVLRYLSTDAKKISRGWPRADAPETNDDP